MHHLLLSTFLIKDYATVWSRYKLYNSTIRRVHIALPCCKSADPRSDEQTHPDCLPIKALLCWCWRGWSRTCFMAQHKHLTKTKAFCVITNTWVSQNSPHCKYIWTHHRETKRDWEGGDEEPVGKQRSLRGLGKHLTFRPHCFPLSCSSFNFHQASTL